MTNTAQNSDWNRQQAVEDDRCGWCQQGARHMRDEHYSSIATYERVVRRQS